MTDGNWHRVTIDLETLVLKIDADEDATAISLRSLTQSLLGNEAKADHSILDLTILLTNAQVTAVQLSTYVNKHSLKNRALKDVKTGTADENGWLCNDSKLIQLRNGQTRFHQSLQYYDQSKLVFSKQICLASVEKSHNFCNCFGPNSVFSLRDRNYPASCSVENGSKGNFFFFF